MRKIWEWIKNNPNRTMFLVPIFLVAGISISHVVSWYDIANPFNWAVYLSIAIEIAAMTALVAATNKIKGGVWFMFGLVTIIQMIGNIFFSFKEIDVNGDLFRSWVELTSPLWEMMGSDPNDLLSQKRWLAFLEGGLLPIISLTSLHFFTKYEPSKKQELPKIETPDSDITDEEYQELIRDFIKQQKEEVEKKRYIPDETELSKIEEVLKINNIEKKPIQNDEDNQKFNPTEEELTEIEKILLNPTVNKEEKNKNVKEVLLDYINEDDVIDEITDEQIEVQQPMNKTLNYSKRDG